MGDFFLFQCMRNECMGNGKMDDLAGLMKSLIVEYVWSDPFQ